MTASSALDHETRALLQNGIARFSQEHRARAGWPSRPDAQRDDVTAIWADIGRNGWSSLGLPETVGGSGASIGDLFPLMRAAGEGLWAAPLIEALGLAGGALLAAAPGPMRDALLGEVAEGTGAVGMVSSARDASARGFTARPCAAGVLLNGDTAVAVAGQAWRKILVPVVMSSTEAVGLAVLDKDATGVAGIEVQTIDGRRAVRFTFEDAPATLLDAGEDAVTAAWQRANLLAAAEAEGIARAALAATIAYLGMRRQFNQPIIAFQAIQHRLVEMHIRACELGAMLEAAGKAYDAQAPHLARLVLQLRAQCSVSAVWITQQAIQLHGGMGMTQDLPIGGYYKRVLFIDSMFGSREDVIDALSAALYFPKAKEP